jgi:excisionase family DNA binding protein
MEEQTVVDSRYYDTNQAAETLGVDVEQVLRWIHDGSLPAYNVARVVDSKKPRWRVAEADLAKFLMGRRSPASQVQTVTPKVSKRPQPKKYV